MILEKSTLDVQVVKSNKAWLSYIISSKQKAKINAFGKSKAVCTNQV
jgi:hypothetical protein